MIAVLGVVPADFRLPAGIDAEAVRLVAEEPLAAVVRDGVGTPLRRADVEAHVDLMARLAEAGTIVPLRLGTFAATDTDVRRDVLGVHADELVELVESVDGRVQMTVRAVYLDGVPIRDAVAANPDLKATSEQLEGRPGEQARDAWIELGRRVAAAVDRLRADDEQAIAERLDGVAEKVLVEEPGDERTAARLQVLVRRDRRAALDDVVRALAEEQAGRLAIHYVGPVAPYSFTDIALDPETAAWA